MQDLEAMRQQINEAFKKLEVLTRATGTGWCDEIRGPVEVVEVAPYEPRDAE